MEIVENVGKKIGLVYMGLKEGGFYFWTVSLKICGIFLFHYSKNVYQPGNLTNRESSVFKLCDCVLKNVTTDDANISLIMTYSWKLESRKLKPIHQ